jgi:UDPglucose 6-dehydrogenase
MKHIGFIGLGKLGMDCAEVFAEQHTVRGYDIYPRDSTSVKVCSIQEVVNSSEWIFIAVPTPHAEGYDGSVPSSHMEPKDFEHDAVVDAINNINKYATGPKKVVLISTVLPGTTRRKFYSLLDSTHQFLYNPYLIAMGSVKWDMVNPEMIMIGTEDGNPNALANELVEIYKTIMQNNPRYEIGTWDECEAIKIFYNTFISAKVGLVNMIQDFALRIGHINVDVVTDALARSTMRIMGPKYMTAGMGDAGACVLPEFKVTVDGVAITMKDLYTEYCLDSEKIRLVDSVNYACRVQDQKKIDIVTCRDYAGQLIKFTTDDGDELLTTPEHLIPVSRNGTRIIVRAEEILETDKLYKIG